MKSSEEKRQVRNYWDAFVLDQPKLKAMVRKAMPEVIHLHGGLSLVVDMNDVRLAKDAVATIVLDPTVDEAIA